MCCRNPNNDGGDVCMPNGLCQGSDGAKTITWRESCTDPTWNSPYCLNGLCTTGVDENGEDSEYNRVSFPAIGSSRETTDLPML